MNATNLVERRCRCDVLNSRVTQNLERTQGLLCGVISQRDAQGQHGPAVNQLVWQGRQIFRKESCAYVAKETKRKDGMEATYKYPRVNYCGRLLPELMTAGCCTARPPEIVTSLTYVLSTRPNILLRNYSQ